MCGKLSPTDSSTIYSYCDAQRSVCACLYRRSSSYKMAALLNTCTTIEQGGVVGFVDKKYVSKGYPQINVSRDL
jgi:hypothetical protein